MRFGDKSAARKAVWDTLQAKRAARFPFPPHGRIPNFAGAREAAARLLAHPVFRRVRVIKVNPDSPQRWVRQLALERGITVITPTPRLKGAFRKLDPARIPREHYAEAATLKRGGKWGDDVSLDELPKVDLVVMGSVAVTRAGGGSAKAMATPISNTRSCASSAIPRCRSRRPCIRCKWWTRFRWRRMTRRSR